jgi:hypothetical protein
MVFSHKLCLFLHVPFAQNVMAPVIAATATVAALLSMSSTHNMCLT